MSSPAPTPPAANQNTPTFGQGTAAFVVSCIFLVILFASALFGFLSPNLAARVVTLCIAVAGSGFTMFLLGNMSWDLPNGLKIGGPLGVFVLLFIWNPGPELQAYLNQALTECETNLEAGSDIAESYCEQAAKELPNDPRPVFLLGVAQGNRGNYAEAIRSWSKALDLGADPALSHYNIAYAKYQLGDYQGAIDAASTAVDDAAAKSGLRARSWFLIAEAENALWDAGKGDNSHFAKAKEMYLAFLEDGSPKYKAEGNLACLLAVKAALISDAAEKSRNEDEAIAHFTQAVNAIKTYVGKGATQEKTSFAYAFGPNASKCGETLADLWARKRPDESYASLIAAAQAQS
jgi:tetratricopeptide (TPR) repeat protein